jgi:hypothetical protein
MKRETIAKQLGVGVASVRSRAGGGKAGVVSRRHEYFCPRDETDLTTAAAPAAPTPSRWGPFSPPWIGIQVRRGCYTNRTSLLGRAIRNGRQHSSQPENTPVKPRRALQRAVSKRAAPFGSPSRPRIGRFRRGASRRSGQAAIVFCMLPRAPETAASGNPGLPCSSTRVLAPMTARSAARYFQPDFDGVSVRLSGFTSSLRNMIESCGAESAACPAIRS